MAPQEGAQLDEPSLKPETSPLSKTNYAFSRQQLNNVMKLLRDSDMEELIKLPKIVLIGNQSAGKSSLIEAISQIKVPRASGTCTRCPMEVILSCSPEQWQAKVSLRLSPEDPRSHPSSTLPFVETFNKGEITLILRRAQLAVLDPNKPLKGFLDLTERQCEEYSPALRFSDSIVVLEISGADVDVTFIDLPGIISNSDDVCFSIFWNLQRLG
jgi:GTPase SAR1 family protein